MQENYYKDKLYPLQDKILNIINRIGNPFYLTGGTALSRFYLEHRFSDDLDFFTNNDKSFAEKTDNICKLLEDEFKVEYEISAKDFRRIIVLEDTIKLKIEFINDVDYHYNGFQEAVCKIDNWQNILSNKISAISREESKDFADLLYISLNFNFNWIEIIEQAKLKDGWVNEIEISKKIDSFDTNSLEIIKWNKKPYLNTFKKYFTIIAKDIILGNDNSLLNNI